VPVIYCPNSLIWGKNFCGRVDKLTVTELSV
jgi:hypothetical protein